MLQIIKEKNDFFTSVERAFDEIDRDWRKYNGVVIVGSHTPDKIIDKLNMIRMCREQNIPFLGICMGMQLMAVEFAKNVLGIENATSQELEPTLSNNIVVKMPQLRVGIFPVHYKKEPVPESHWHNYKVNEGFIDLFSVNFDTIITQDFMYGKVLEYMKLKDHKHFVGTQFHPEYQSSKDKPHPILLEFIKICKKNG